MLQVHLVIQPLVEFLMTRHRVNTGFSPRGYPRLSDAPLLINGHECPLFTMDHLCPNCLLWWATWGDKLCLTKDVSSTLWYMTGWLSAAWLHQAETPDTHSAKIIIPDLVDMLTLSVSLKCHLQNVGQLQQLSGVRTVSGSIMKHSCAFITYNWFNLNMYMKGEP